MMSVNFQERPSPVPAQPAAMPEVHRQLSRLAVLHHIPSEERNGKYLPNVHTFEDAAGEEYLNLPAGIHIAQHLPPKPRKFRLPSSHDPMKLPEWAANKPEAVEKEQMLREVHETIRSEAHTFPGEKKRINWLGTSRALLGKAEVAESESARGAMLVGATVSMQFSPDEAERTTFLEEVYQRGLQREVAAACDRSKLVVLTGPLPKGKPAAVDVHSVKGFAPAFQLDQKELSTYLDYVKENSSQRRVGQASAKALLKRVVKHSAEGTIDEATQREAAEASQGGEKVGGSILDMRKVERFALQEVFIKKQMQEVIGPDVKHAPLKQVLENLRNQPNRLVDQNDAQGKPPSVRGRLYRQTAQLQIDVEKAFALLSAPVVEQFSLEDVDLGGKAPLTPEQRAAIRYRDVVQSIEGHMAVARFLAPEEFVRRKGREIITTLGGEIGETSRDGGDSPRSGAEMIKSVVSAALQNEALGGVSPEELRGVTRVNRWKLLQMATYNVADLRTAVATRKMQPKLGRDQNGELQLTNAFPTASKESLDIYAAVTLGCPALPVIHENRKLLTAEQKAAHGSSNYVDHVLAVIINEAYDRGLFDLRNYQTGFQRPKAA